MPDSDLNQSNITLNQDENEGRSLDAANSMISASVITD
jgi:hypothetical protein